LPVALFLIFCNSVALASNVSVVFPPANCSASERKVIAWQDGAPNTYCLSGQEVLSLALPDCTDGQQVVFRQGEAGVFVCEQPVASLTLPKCKEGEVLTTRNDATLTCVPASTACACCDPPRPPRCGADEVLTSNGDALSCRPIVDVRSLFVCNAKNALFNPTHVNADQDGCVGIPHTQLVPTKTVYREEIGGRIKIPAGKVIAKPKLITLADAPAHAKYVLVRWYMDNNGYQGNFGQFLYAGHPKSPQLLGQMDSGVYATPGLPPGVPTEHNQSAEAVIAFDTTHKQLSVSCVLKVSTTTETLAGCTLFVTGYIVDPMNPPSP